MADFYNPTPCGVGGNLPGVAVYNPSVECPGAGFGASTYPSQATALAIGLTTNVARFTFTSSAAARNVYIGGELSAMCEARIEAEVGGDVVHLCAEGVATANGAGENFCCFLELGGIGVIGLVGKPSEAITELSGTQILFDPCNPCFASDTVFVCNNGCGDSSNFILSNAVVGRNAGFVLNIPAGTALRLDICSCAPEVNSYATCPSQSPAVAQIAAGPACPPAFAPQNGAYGNGVNTFTGRQF